MAREPCGRRKDMAEGFRSSADEAALKEVLALAKKEKVGDYEENGEPTFAFASFVGQLVRFATGEDKIWDEPQSLLDRVASAWSASAVRKPGEQLISLRMNDAKDWRQSRLVLDIVTEDKPFLVDSITAALFDSGKPASFFVNAVIGCDRDAKGRRKTTGGVETIRESMIHAELDPPVDEAEVERLEAELRRVLFDVAAAVADWEPMRSRLGACIAQLERARPEGVPREELREAVEFLKWLWDNRFAFLGVRRYRYAKTAEGVDFTHDEEGDLGILRGGSERRILKSTYSEAGHLSPAVEDFMASSEVILVAKANAKSLVHRRGYMDYIGVKTYSIDGKVNGEERFVGLFTAEAYNRPASDIPLLRSKVRKVVEAAGFQPGGHNEKALINILETFPRDEMFQDDVETLGETAVGILRLYKRPRVKLFMRRDRFDRFISALVYVPREQFSSEIREAIGNFLAATFNGRVSAFYPFFGDAALVRVHFIIGIDPGAPEGPGIAELTRQIRAICRDWSDDLLDALRAAHQGATPRGLFQKYERAFDAAYKEDNPASEALDDIAVFEQLGDRDFHLRVFRWPENPASTMRIKIYNRDEPVRLSSLIPTIENLGLSVIHESEYEVRLDNDNKFWIQDFYSEDRFGREIDIGAVKKNIEEAMTAVMDGRAEDDGFNALVVEAGLNWREAWMLRAAAKYHLQAGFAFSQKYIEEALSAHPQIARELIAVFHARFNPAGPKDPAKREAEVEKTEARVLKSLEGVESLDEDRIMRRYLNLFSAILRTNYYQRGADGAPKPYISFKIDSAKIDTLPAPRPYREIFVSSPRVDGVHLRFGPVARGGLRWSDRREDFRTEVLGLVKAQRVKNAVIVPTGSKGGFYPKQLPAGDRAAIFEEGREAYKIFIRGLLDLTDNIVGNEIKRPANMVLWDDPDPYLVVAADKGTATFSDTANAISAEYGFWLGDAFASGGSAGYDHKAMGITARGAWEAVKRHFREMGKDIQSEPFTAIGVGDMSGDVFGNGMLLSKKTKLVAAFDHRDIFLDPDPDPEKSWAERKRLFELPRSSWADYDKKLISKGGGVFSRNSKSITLTPEIKKLLGISADKATPIDVIRSILKADVELFWLGGIGTYVKASHEENAKVGDRGNDALRINADELRAKVVGEGANLGFTQAARIEFARNGGRINTDAIDNSAGVDTSDHEVNIKILLSSAIEHGDLRREERDPLLASMTEDVAAHVLRHNYEQTRALSMMEATAPQDLDGHARLMIVFEQQGRLDRAVEGLPDVETISALRARGFGLTRPEMAVLLAYSKMWLFEALVASDAPDDPLLETELFGYFPEPLHGFTDAIVRHRLRREIIATRLSNEIVDTCGASFPYRAVEATGARPAQVALAYEAARRILNLGDYAAAVDALDNKAPAGLQIALYNAAADLLREQLYRIVSDPDASTLLGKRGLKGVIEQYHEPIKALKESLYAVLSAPAAAALKARIADWKKGGAPAALAQEAALMPSLEYAFDIVNLARRTGWSAKAAGAVFFAVGDRFGIDEARNFVKESPPVEHFDKLATRRLVEDLSARQSALSASVIAFGGDEPKGAPTEWLDNLIERWREAGDGAFEGYEDFVASLELTAGVTVSKLSLLSKKLGDVAGRLRAC
ncbi:MAG: NAD-glutamate dehydrogenase [Alphaproteobacteria bacterium]|nr:NAD-glutamate dehydrogenase [Alphaproteobacteria bacterium]